MGKFSIFAGKKWRFQPIAKTKRSKKVSPVFFKFKFQQDKLSDFARKEDCNLLP